MSDILGSGLAFPLTSIAAAGLRWSAAVKTSNRRCALILGTAPGERPMRPEFGCGIHDLVFDTIDAATVGRIEPRSAWRSTAGSRGST